MSGHREPDEGPTSVGGDDSAIGLELYDPSTLQLIGTLVEVRLSPTGGPRLVLRRPDGSIGAFQAGDFFTAFNGQPNRAIGIDAQGNLTDFGVATRFLPDAPSAGPAGPRITFQQEVELLDLQQKFQLTEAEKNRKFELEQIKQQQQFELKLIAKEQGFTTSERRASQAFQAEQARLAEENRQRESLQAQAASLLEQWLGIQGQARELLTSLQGKDPFRAAAAASGQVTRGKTPQQALEANLRATVGQELTFDPSGNVGALQGQVADLRHQVGTGLPEVPAFVGAFAHGGTIDMEAGRDGVFRAKGRSDGFRDVDGRGPVSFVVGEAVDGQPNPELVTIENGRVTVTPVKDGLRNVEGRGIPAFAGGFSHGGSFQTPTNQSLLQASSSIFGELGFENIPTSSFRKGGEGALRPFRRTLPAGLDLQGVLDFERARPPDFTLTSLERLGISPRLVRNDRTGRIFFRTDDGQYRRIADMGAFRQFGFNPNEVVSMSEAELQSLGVFDTEGGELAVPGVLGPLSDIGERTEFGPLPFPLLAPIGNQQVPLPDPRLIANLFRRLDVAGQQNLLSLYGVTPGITADSALERIRFFTVAGRAQPGTTASLR